MHMRAKGSITVYLSLMLVLMLSLLFALLESARVRGLQVDADRMTQAASESVFAEYCRPLLEDYDLFLLDGAYGTGSFSGENVQARMLTFLQTNADAQDDADDTQIDFFSVSPQSVEVSGWQIATDDEGAAYYEMACNYALSALPVLVVSDLAEYLTGGAQSDETEDASDEIFEALEALEDDANYSDEENTDLTEEEIEAAEQVTEETKGILETVSEMKSKGILSLLVEDAGDLSTQAITLSDTASVRELEAGTATLLDGDGSRLLFQWYLGEKFTSFRDEAQEDHALRYELEYCYAGKDSDAENLESTAESILLIREGINLAYLMTDTEKKSEARIVAIAIAGIFAVPALISVIEGAVLAAWAFLESVKDVQMLLAGDSVPLVKTASTWQTSLSGSGSTGGSGSGTGVSLTYENYLQVLLMTRSREKLIMRSLDLIEQNVRLTENYESFRIDACIAGASWSVTWTGSALFPALMSIGVQSAPGSYSFVSEGTFVYE